MLAWFVFSPTHFVVSTNQTDNGMAAILSHVGKSTDKQTEVTVTATPYRNWYFVSRETEDGGKEYYSAHENGKHVFLTEENPDIWTWEMWRMEEFVTDNDETVHLMKTHHDTYIYMDHESGYIWQTKDPAECDQDDLVTLDVTEFPEPLTDQEEDESEEDDEEESTPEYARMMIMKNYVKNKGKKKDDTESEEEEEEEEAPKKKKVATATTSKSSKKEPKEKKEPKKKKKEVDPDKPKRKPNTKLLAFQAYCKDNRAKVKEESPEAKLGEQQKILSSGWKEESDEVRDGYEQQVMEKLAADEEEQ